MARGSITRRVAVLGTATLLAISSSTAITTAPAGAIDVATGTTDLLPVTWVDTGGRQYLAYATGATGALQVARDTPAGEPDASWGTADAKKGVRALTIAPPAAGATMHRLLAASG